MGGKYLLNCSEIEIFLSEKLQYLIYNRVVIRTISFINLITKRKVISQIKYDFIVAAFAT